MRVCHITTVHPRYDIRIFKKMCTSLANKGHEVCLVVADGNGDEFISGVKIVDVGNFTLSRLKRAIKAPTLVLKKAVPLDADCYHIHDPELLRVGLTLKKRGKTVVYDSHEDVPNQILYKTWLGPLFLRKLIAKTYNRFEKNTVKKLDGLISVIEEITEKFNCKEKITIKNFPPLHLIQRYVLPIKQRNNEMIYVGGLSEVRGIKDYIEALDYLPDDFKLVLIGAFSSEVFERQCRQLPSWDRVEYLGYLPVEKAMQRLVKAKIGLSVLHPEKNYLASLPTKGFEYMAALVPCVMSNFSYWKPYFSETGVLITPKSSKRIADAVFELLNNEDLYTRKVENCKLRYADYSWENEAKRYECFLESLTKKTVCHDE